YNGIDKSLQHYKRYNKQTFRELLSKHENATNLFYFNAMGIPAWFLGGKLSKKNTIPKSKMNGYDFFVPFWKMIDRITFSKEGLSLVCVMQKTA
ncbi:MAG: class I SAM-dependent methyltransferase, partial [Candidatus Aminicenantes bacterium]|nr:class I SAM-dependent methyltransferase [Candidatus Aminicenantes bacterium]